MNYNKPNIIVPKFNEASGFYTTKERSKIMSKIRGKNTKPCSEKRYGIKMSVIELTASSYPENQTSPSKNTTSLFLLMANSGMAIIGTKEKTASKAIAHFGSLKLNATCKGTNRSISNFMTWAIPFSGSGQRKL